MTLLLDCGCVRDAPHYHHCPEMERRRQSPEPERPKHDAGIWLCCGAKAHVSGFSGVAKGKHKAGCTYCAAKRQWQSERCSECNQHPSQDPEHLDNCVNDPSQNGRGAPSASCGCPLGREHDPNCSYMKDWREKQPESYARLQEGRSLDELEAEANDLLRTPEVRAAYAKGMSELLQAPAPQLCRHCGYAKQAHVRGFCPAPDPGESRSAFSKYEARVTAGPIPKAEDDTTLPILSLTGRGKSYSMTSWLFEKDRWLMTVSQSTVDAPERRQQWMRLPANREEAIKVVADLAWSAREADTQGDKDHASFLDGLCRHFEREFDLNDELVD